MDKIFFIYYLLIMGSKKVCVSKTFLILLIVLAGIASSILYINKRILSSNFSTSSQAAKPNIGAYRPLGGTGKQCIRSGDSYYCSSGVNNLVCKAQIDFWLATASERFTRYKKGETKCVNYYSPEIPKGAAGNLCRDDVNNACDPGLSCVYFLPIIRNYLITTPEIKNYISKVQAAFANDPQNYNLPTPVYSGESESFFNIVEKLLEKYYFINFTNYPNNQSTPTSVFKGICVPDEYTNEIVCGDANEPACDDESGPYCFNDLKYSWQTYICGNCGGQGQEPCMGKDDLASQPVCNNPLIMKPDPLNTDLLTCQP